MQVQITVDTENNHQINEAIILLGRMVKTEASPTTPEKDEAPKKTPTKVKPKVTPKKDVEPKSEPKTEAKEMTLDELKAIAKESLTKSDRDTVKATINKFGAKLAEVDARMYSELATALKAL